jgi:sulfate adenylyltransferase
MPTSRLIEAHGGTLRNLIVDQHRASALRAASGHWPSWDLSAPQLCDLELLVTGAFSPLTGFMTRADYEPVRDTMRLADGTLWPIPVALDIPADLARSLKNGGPLALRDDEGTLLAVLHVEDLWQPDAEIEARAVLGTTEAAHPGVASLCGAHPWRAGGRVEALAPPTHHDFTSWRFTPSELRQEFDRLGWQRVVAFQTRNPLHRAHQEMTLRAARQADAKLLLHPVVGTTRPGDIDHYTRVRCYRAVLPRYPAGLVKLALLPLAMRMAGPREAVWHAIIRKNHGCTHLVVGRDHAGPGRDSRGVAFYEPLAAQHLLRRHEAELGITMVPFDTFVYLADEEKYVPQDEVPAGARVLELSGTELREHLNAGRGIPSWFTFPEVSAELQRTHWPRRRQGFTVFFTGLSGSGKSTTANVLRVKLLERGGRAVTLLDGDIVRRHLSSELGFSKEHRDLNIRRIGYVASEITKHGGIALCAPIAPYDDVRKHVRRMIEPLGGFVLVHLATPLEVCEQRDRKGLYARARAGLLEQFTGISDPYEPPLDAEIVVDAGGTSPEEAAHRIVQHLEHEGYLAVSDEPTA